ncbi:PAS domain-containing protein [Microbaculum marinum]|uniref:PAS domain-containing protein n=1 Tax=Microbaculum marinum TaxID=1764581 RepID=A0AAW9RT18_9HYPH
MNVLSQSSADRGLVDAIYDAGLSVDCWQGVVNALAQQFPGSKVVLFSEDVQGRTGMAFVNCGLSDSVVAKYAARLSGINPWVPVAARLPAHVPHVADDVLPSSSFANTEFYAEYISAQEGVESATWIKLYDDESRFAALYVHYPRSAADNYNKAVPILLRELTPLFRHAIELNQRISRRPSEALRSIIDATRAATFVIGADGAVWLCNRAAELALDSGRLVSIDDSGCLVLSDPEPQSRLQALRAQWCRRLAVTDNLVSVKRPDGTADVWTFTPFCGARHAHTAWLDSAAPLLLVSHERRERGTVINIEKLSKVYKLTPAEARLAGHIASGRALREASAEYKIAIGTARNQLKSVFNKVGVHRQNELVALIAEKFSEF